MNLVELKTSIDNKNVTDKLIVFECDDSFLAEQYINEISNIKGVEINYVEELSPHSNPFDAPTELTVMFCENFKLPFAANFLDNTIVVCKKSDYEDRISLTKLEEWQIKDYVKGVAPGLSDDRVEKLYKVTKGNIFRIDKEISKISMFDTKSHNIIFDNIIKNGDLSDTSDLTVFNMTNAIVRKDVNGLKNALISADAIGIDTFQLLGILVNNFKNIINVQLTTNATPESTGLSQKQFNAARYNCGKYTNDGVFDIYELLTSIDYKIKSGELPEKFAIDYMIANIVSL